ncbi:hypothetical protein ACR52_01375 [Pseudomonas fildesensis]|jgi:hypothetical protein|uniref:Uncharacterized protein n=1 Tax=Pseudomonas fildesensis TaxID=1674920 RepID=A0A0J8IZ19_9PSED|nr:hypothetical protein ACR52_01375 [Pseudomonas fildesensis]
MPALEKHHNPGPGVQRSLPRPGRYQQLFARCTCHRPVPARRHGWLGWLGWPISGAYLAGALMVNRFVARTGRLTMMSWGVASLLVSQQAWPLALLCVALAGGAYVCVARCRTDQNALRKISSI